MDWDLVEFWSAGLLRLPLRCFFLGVLVAFRAALPVLTSLGLANLPLNCFSAFLAAATASLASEALETGFLGSLEAFFGTLMVKALSIGGLGSEWPSGVSTRLSARILAGLVGVSGALTWGITTLGMSEAVLSTIFELNRGFSVVFSATKVLRSLRPRLCFPSAALGESFIFLKSP